MNIDSEIRTILRTSLILALTGEGADDFSEAEISQLVNKYHNYLLALLRFKTGNEETAMELLQETYLSFLKIVSGSGMRRKFENEKKIKNYLITIALNKVKNHYRISARDSVKRKLFGNREEMDECFNNISAAEPGVEQQILDDERTEMLKTLVAYSMERLSDRYRIVLEYKFTMCLDNQEIASRLGIGIKAAESLLHRARMAFKKEIRKIILKENGFYDDLIDL